MLLRDAVLTDAPALAALPNNVVDEGDTTAIDEHLDAAAFSEWFLTGSHHVSCVVAVSTEPPARPLGFQVVEVYEPDLPAGWADIATFVAGDARGSGIGRALVAATLDRIRTRRVTALRAVIGSDNHSAIAYYRRSGFVAPEADRPPRHSSVNVPTGRRR